MLYYYHQPLSTAWHWTDHKNSSVRRSRPFMWTPKSQNWAQNQDYETRNQGIIYPHGGVLFTPFHGLFVPWIIRKSYHRWTVHTLHCFYRGVFVPSWTTTDYSYQSRVRIAQGTNSLHVYRYLYRHFFQETPRCRTPIVVRPGSSSPGACLRGRSRCHEFPPSRSVLSASLRSRQSKIHRSQLGLHGSEPGLPWTSKLSGGPTMQAWRARWWSCPGSARYRCPMKDRRRLRTVSDRNGCPVRERISSLVTNSDQCMFRIRLRHQLSSASIVFDKVTVTDHVSRSQRHIKYRENARIIDYRGAAQFLA